MIDFSEPECSNCFHCPTSEILNSQESKPSNAIGLSVPSMPVISGQVQALSHGSVQGSSPLSFGVAHAATTSISSGPAQSLDPTIFSYGAFVAPSQRPAFPVTVSSGASATSTSSISSPVHSSSSLRFGSAPAVTSVSSVPTQALGQTTFSLDASAAPTPPRFGSIEAPVRATFGSGACSTSTTFSFLPFGVLPSPSSSTTTIVFGTTPVSVSSQFGPAQDFPKTTYVSASSTPAVSSPASRCTVCGASSSSSGPRMLGTFPQGTTPAL